MPAKEHTHNAKELLSTPLNLFSLLCSKRQGFQQYKYGPRDLRALCWRLCPPKAIMHDQIHMQDAFKAELV